MAQDETIDVVLIGGGIMSATLGTLLHALQPDWSIRIYERLGGVAEESSNPWNNAGTGHAALCELNYTPERPDGSIDITSAVKVNEQFQVSREFWASLAEHAKLPKDALFINSTPHMTFVRGKEHVDYLRRRWEALTDHPLFADMEYSEDPKVIHDWAPLLMVGRDRLEPVAATRAEAGTDVDFGALTRALMDGLVDEGADLRLNTEVTGLKRLKNGLWRIRSQHSVGLDKHEVSARYVFVGAGGWALKLLQKAGIPEAKGYGLFPISGQWLRSDDPAIVAKHRAKVYGKASLGAPPMSVPHLDTRIVDGRASLLFGPYAGLSPRFLKKGNLLDLPLSVRPHNLIPMLAVAKDNFALVQYLVRELTKSKKAKFASLQEFYPDADPKDWYPLGAGQRAQVIKKDPKKGGVLQFGTEVVSGADGTIAGLLGASPGASTAAAIMLDVVRRSFPDRLAAWEPELRRLIPTYGSLLSDDPRNARRIQESTARTLGLTA
ncbi:malate:quinone oxidoreductase [Amnibacterium kyonggiense]|uniref:Probable malate:quinone oxidoreductase n=1 Tax=Amnibacterium kyonggiense TaxID=595671 RepID=A0A4R7FH90_9MICO|nr:malate:quinone oxidoreductase [Amnibacterium kyonggiense]TDS75080.1 malate dehydrogenase (quinone) [Amnibacterium kyonggiense]